MKCHVYALHTSRTRPSNHNLWTTIFHKCERVSRLILFRLISISHFIFTGDCYARIFFQFTVFELFEWRVMEEWQHFFSIVCIKQTETPWKVLIQSAFEVSLVRFMILHNLSMKTKRLHFLWSYLYSLSRHEGCSAWCKTHMKLHMGALRHTFHMLTGAMTTIMSFPAFMKLKKASRECRHTAQTNYTCLNFFLVVEAILFSPLENEFHIIVPVLYNNL